MYSIGIDSIEIDRVSKSIEKPSFISRVFGKEESSELNDKGFPAESAAACFAAKEAFGKALGTGLTAFDLNEVQVLHNQAGKPYLSPSGAAKAAADCNNLDFDISITHTKTVATAVVIAFERR